MAPFRPSGRSNRSGRGQVDHDVFEGLPIRQWRQSDAVVGPAANQNQQPLSKDDWPEHPMPRDSHLLPDHSQILLRAARAGRLYKLPTPPDEEEKEKGEEDEEAKETQTGYVTKKWSQVPRNLEEPEPEYLAKRRKGLPSAFSGSSSSGHPAPAGPMRETKVKKTDAEGNVHVYKVLVPEGQTVEGEVAEEDVEMKEAAPEEAAPGTVVEGVGIVNAEGVVVANQPTPPRRRPPPPRRKPKKGPGRGRKKVMFTGGEGANGATTNPDGTLRPGDPNIKTEGTPNPGDTPMAEGGEDDEEGSGSSEGEDEDDENREGSPTPGGNTPLPKTEGSATPAAAPTATEAPQSVPPEGDSAPVATTEVPSAIPPAPPAFVPEPVIPKKRRAESGDRDGSSSPDLPLASGDGNNSRPTSEPRKTRTPTPTAKKSATPPRQAEVKETVIEAPQPPAPEAAPEQLSTQAEELMKEDFPEPKEEKPEKPEKPEKLEKPEKPEKPKEQPELPAEQPAEQQPSPEKMDVDPAPQSEPQPPAPPAEGQSEEKEVDIFGSLEQQLENEGKS